MKPYGERNPRVHWLENHGCPCCHSYKLIPHDERKPSKVRERQQGERVIREATAPTETEAMRNRYAGYCYLCGLWVPAGAGHFERHKGKWRVKHANVPGDGRITCSMANDEDDYDGYSEADYGDS